MLLAVTTTALAAAAARSRGVGGTRAARMRPPPPASGICSARLMRCRRRASPTWRPRRLSSGVVSAGHAAARSWSRRARRRRRRGRWRRCGCSCSRSASASRRSCARSRSAGRRQTIEPAASSRSCSWCAARRTHSPRRWAPPMCSVGGGAGGTCPRSARWRLRWRRCRAATRASRPSRRSSSAPSCRCASSNRPWHCTTRAETT